MPADHPRVTRGAALPPRPRLAGLLPSLAYVVVDELHAFMGTERGKQLQSLLHRIETALGRSVIGSGSRRRSGTWPVRHPSCALTRVAE